MIRFISLIGFNLLFNSVFVQYIFNKNSLIAYDALLNIQKDLGRISFPTYFELNYFFVAAVLSILMSVLVYFFVNKSNFFDSPVDILNDFLKLFLIFTGSVFSIFYMLGLYSMSRGTVLLAMFIYPFISFIFLVFFNLNVFIKSSNNLVKLILTVLTVLIFSGLFFIKTETPNQPFSCVN